MEDILKIELIFENDGVMLIIWYLIIERIRYRWIVLENKLYEMIRKVNGFLYLVVFWKLNLVCDDFYYIFSWLVIGKLNC